MNRMRHAMGVVACLSAALLSGCDVEPTEGYTLQSQYRPGIRTVDVPIWTVSKDVYRRGLEYRLTEAIKKRIELDTPYKIARRGRADTRLTGQIEKIEQRVISSNPRTGRPMEQEVAYTVSLRWVDLRTGEQLARRKDLRVTASYIPHAPVGEDFFLASEDALNKLAVRVVEEMEADW